MFFKLYLKDSKAYGSTPRKIIKLEDEREGGEMWKICQIHLEIQEILCKQ